MKAKNLLEVLERYDNYAVCPGCQGCEGKKVIACRDLIRQAAARIRGQERHMTDEGQAMLQWILRNAAAVDLTDAQK